MSAAQISTTAYCVVCGLYKLANTDRWSKYLAGEAALLNAAFAEHAGETPVKQFMRRVPPRLYTAISNVVFIPGMTEHFLFRKRLIEQTMAAAIRDGVQQVVVLGGGLDTLALRSASRYKDVEFFEIDLPGTQQKKLEILSQVGQVIAQNCSFVPADLSKSTLEVALKSLPRFKADVPTLVILEGVLMYLKEGDVKNLFKSMHALFTGGLSVVFGAIASSDSDNKLAVRLFNAVLSKVHESTNWHCSAKDMPAFMAGLGYKLESWISYGALQRCYGVDTKKIPEDDENYYVVTKVDGAGRVRVIANIPVIQVEV